MLLLLLLLLMFVVEKGEVADDADAPPGAAL
jgi:hypothetical protein